MNRNTEHQVFQSSDQRCLRNGRSRQVAELLTLAAGALLAIAVIAPSRAAEANETGNTPALQLTGNIGVASQYVFRGTTQTNEKPALQGGFDLTHSSGLYAGVWLSNISWISDTNSAASASLETDIYAGWKPVLTDWLTGDIGLLRYQYPGSYPDGMIKPNTTELYLGLDAKWIAFKYSYSTGDTFGNANTSGSTYADLSVNHELFASINGVAHIGRQRYTGPSSSALSYTDWKIGVTRDFSGYVVGLTYSDTNTSAAGYTIKGKNIGRSQVVRSLNKTF